MKGIVFKVFEQFVVEKFGEQFYEDLLDECELQTQGPFAAPGTYPDSDLFALVTRTIQTAGIPLDQALRAFGAFLFHGLLAAYPAAADKLKDPLSMMRHIDSVIHVEVKKLWPDAMVPRFHHRDLGPDRIELRYESERGLCALVQGLIDGVSEHFDVPVANEHTSCKARGADACLFDVRVGVPS